MRHYPSNFVTGNVTGTICNNGSGATGTVLQSSERVYFSTGLVKEEISPDGAKVAYAYDRLGRVGFITDPDGRVFRNTYNAASEVTSSSVRMGAFAQVTGRYLYNLNGVNKTIRDANDNRTDYIFDGHDRLIETRYPSLTTANTSDPNDRERYQYDPNSNLTKLTTRSGQNITYAYDGLNRLITKTPVGSQKVAYAYDLSGRQTQVKFTTGNAHQIDYGYDSAGRLVAVTDKGRAVTYELDKSGLQTQLTFPDLFKISYQYDGAGRPKSISRGPATAPVAKVAAYTYDTLGRRSVQKLGASVTVINTGYTYHTDNALATLNQNIAGTANDVVFGLSYLPGNQVSAMTVSKPGYVFNEPFNQDFDYTANRLNQVGSVNFGRGFTAELSYDGNGNLTSDGQAWTYAYDVENRLTSATGTDSTATFGYDPIGRRAAKTVTGPASSDTRYLYDGAEVIADTAAGGAVLRRYVYGPGIDEPVVMYAGAGAGAPRYYMTDPQGSVIGLTNGTGALLEQHSYSAFGQPDDWAAGATGNPLRYTAQPFDAETGLYYYRARYYSPSLGRFLSPDPIGYSDGLNLYAYVGNDPVNFSDPSGLVIEKGKQGAGSALIATGNYINRHPTATAVTIAGLGVALDIATIPSGEGAAIAAASPLLAVGFAKGLTRAGKSLRAGTKGGKGSAPDFVVTPGGTAFPVPKSATGPVPSINNAGKQTGSAFVGGKGGANRKVESMRIMDPTPPRGKAPGYPRG